MVGVSMNCPRWWAGKRKHFRWDGDPMAMVMVRVVKQMLSDWMLGDDGDCDGHGDVDGGGDVDDHGDGSDDDDGDAIVILVVIVLVERVGWCSHAASVGLYFSIVR